ncbi:MAG: hypothetical protein IT270_18245 [Saprospiraceae bacterium]|nr:hypothetical protein [Saprospiraceae bacterium]
MNNKGFNPLFVSALDILTGALGVFIVLNFLRTNNPPPTPIQPPALAQNGTPADKATTNAREGKGDYRYTRPPAPKPQPSNPTPSNPNPQTGSTQTPAQNTPATTPPPVTNPNPVTPQPQSAPQDPVAVDLMRSTQGVVVLLLQQFGQAKNSVEFMIRQGNRTWKPTRASKYQDNVFAYNKALNYYYQTELQPGTYEVLVRTKRGSKSSGNQNFALYGKLAGGGKSQSYSFGNFGFGGSSGSDWVSAGTFRVSASTLDYGSRLPKAAAASAPENNTPAPSENKPTKETPQKGRTGKWGK